MTEIYYLDQIREVVKELDFTQIIEDGFIAYSQGRVVVPPVGELIFKNPPGECHIKYGYIIDDDYYVIKIASGFYATGKSSKPTSSGLMLVFKQKTGDLACILLEDCYLTNVRTAVAGAVVAKYLAPKNVVRIGIFGAGTQGRMQLEYLKPITDCREVITWGLNQEELDEYKKDMGPFGFNVETSRDSNDVTSTCNLIVTATPSTSPLFPVDQIRAGTHITAIGSDTAEKKELDSRILKKADIVVTDSLSQCFLRGEIHQALKAGLLKKEDVFELGNVIMNKDLQRTTEEQITVADLTGVAIQDIQISKAVYEGLESRKSHGR